MAAGQFRLVPVNASFFEGVNFLLLLLLLLRTVAYEKILEIGRKYLDVCYALDLAPKVETLQKIKKGRALWTNH